MKEKLNTIINGVDTPLGKAFDVTLIGSILISSCLIILDSVQSIHLLYGPFIAILQSVFLILFTIEYGLRLFISKPMKDYVFSFYGIIDLLAIVPVFIGLFLSFGRFFPIIRILRLLRLFSVFKMGRYLDESGVLLRALRASKVKITVFIVTIVFIVIIVGAIMYVIEGPDNGFVNIPEGMYWAVVTISTVGYGDVSPQTHLGKLIASALMLVGYGIIAVPTGIITSEITLASKEGRRESRCDICGQSKHPKNAKYCHQCGHKIH